MRKGSYFLWVLYDFANSLALVNVAFYFSLWLVSDHGFSDFWVSFATIVSTLLLIFSLPTLARRADRSSQRMRFLSLFSLLAIASLAALGILAMKLPFTQNLGFIVLFFYFLFQFFFQGSFAFYDSFVRDIADKNPSEQVSAMGMGFGQLGNIVGVLLILPVAEGKIEIFGETGRPATFLAAALLFFIFVLPVLIFLKDPKHAEIPEKQSRSTSSFKKIFKIKGLFPYLLSYYFFADAILTLQLFLGLYLEETLGMDDREKTMVIVIALVFGCIGAWLAPLFARLVKSTRRALHLLIGSWAVLLGVYSMVTNPTLFYILIVFNGLAFGALFSLSRSYYAKITPSNEQAEFFSIYSLFERASSILGPLVWSSTVLLFASQGADKYRFAMFSLAILVMISFVIFFKVPNETSHEKMC